MDPPGHVVSDQLRQIIFSTIGSIPPLRNQGFMFQAAITDTSNGIFTSTLTTITEVSLLNGSVITCSSGGSMESLTLILAGEAMHIHLISVELTMISTDPPTSPSTPMVASRQNGASSSNITLEWDSPSSTGGVSVSYVLIISPTPSSRSPVTVQTTSVQIITSYNTPYNVTIRAVNCAGMSQKTSIVDLSKPFH